MEKRRDVEPLIAADLLEKMVFLAGPRQVGKTTVAKRLLRSEPEGVYLSWDNRQDRTQIRAGQWPASKTLVVLDELHKWRGWKGWLKGEFDRHRERLRFLVTGSARLDVYRRGGDSLQGRYHLHRLHPFSVAELTTAGTERLTEPFAELPIGRVSFGQELDALMTLGGFPEPLLSGSLRTARRWQRAWQDRFFREDVRDLEAVRDLSAIQLLAELLATRVQSPLSANSLREDLDVSHKAVSHWLDILERLYFLVRIAPFSTRQVRSLRKMPKAYLWDWAQVPERAARFENLVAMHLLKFCHRLEDTEGRRAALHYLRDKSAREVDFLVTCDRKPWFAVEAKLAEQAADPSLRYFGERLKIPWLYQVSLEGKRDFLDGTVRCLPAAKLLPALA